MEIPHSLDGKLIKKLTAEELSNLFELDEIRDGRSLKALDDLGGIPHLLQSLETSLEKGIDPSTITNRKSIYGSNSPSKSQSPLSFLIKSITNFGIMALILLAGILLIVNLLQDPSEGWKEGVTILVAVSIVVGVTSINNYLKEKILQNLCDGNQESFVTVIRACAEVNISIYDLVVGDIIKVKSGDLVPADCLVLRSTSLIADESWITEVSCQVQKGLNAEESPFLLSGSLIYDGNALAVVLNVGINTFSGNNLKKSVLNTKEPSSPLQMKLNNVNKLFWRVGIVVAVLTLVALMAYTFVGITKDGWVADSTGKIIHSLIIGATIVVIAAPESLPFVFSVGLSYFFSQMKKQNSFIRHLAVSESIGQATCICLDKTGVMTKDIMEVVALYAEEKHHDTLPSVSLSENSKELLILNSCLNSTANFSITDGKETYDGNRVDVALLKLAKLWGVNYKELRNPHDIVIQIPFDSRIKRMSTIVHHNKRIFLFTKGAFEKILPLCEFYTTKEGETKHLNNAQKDFIQSSVIGSFERQSYRTFTFAYKEIDPSDPLLNDLTDLSALEQNLVFQGIAGIDDPMRDGVSELVSYFQHAGVVRMFTGDTKEKAIAVAINCGILPRDYNPAYHTDFVMTGAELRKRVEGLQVNPDDEKDFKVKNLDEFKKVVANLRVLARSSPEDKLLLVAGLKELNNVVVSVGDGSNDVPAMVNSNVGFAMNSTSTQLAREVSDILLLDDNISSIMTAILWGRYIYDNIHKFLQFQLTVNIIALLVCFVGSAIIGQSPLTAVQLLWVNLIMDSFAALALATELPQQKLSIEKPEMYNDLLVSLDMIKSILGQVIYQCLVLTFILFLLPDFSLYLFGEEFDTQTEKVSLNFNNATHITIFFNAFVLMQVFNLINCKKPKSSEFNVFRGLFNSKLFLLFFGLIAIIQLLIVEFGGKPTNCCPLTLRQHLFCYGLGVGGLLFGMVFRLVPLSIFRICCVPVSRINPEAL